MTRHTFVALAFTAAAGMACQPKPPPVDGEPPPYTLTAATVVTQDGGRVDWSPDGTTLVFDRIGSDDKWDIWLMSSDGGDERCLTCDHPDVPDGDNGQPVFHPSGEWIAFQSESPDHPANNLPTFPGAGVYNDLVAMRLSDRAFFMLNDVRDGTTSGDNGGTLHPAFSHAGDQLLWTDYERGCFSDVNCLIGDWRIALADFRIEGDTPTLGAAVHFEPGVDQLWYETHGFGPDDSWIYFSAASEGQGFLSSDILRMNLADAPNYERLTTTAGRAAGEFAAYDEHAKLSPAGDAFVWLNDESGISEYWMANPDGSGRFQLTDFNTDGHEHAALVDGLRSVPSDNAWNPAAAPGTAQVMSFVQVDFDVLQNSAPRNFLVRLDFEHAL